MRKILIAAAAVTAVAAPAFAFAQPERYPEPPVRQDRWDEGAEEVRLDPAEVRRMAMAMDRLVGAVMDLPIGGIAEAIDPEARGEFRPGDTVRDIAERDDPYAEERLRAGIQGATRGIGAMSEAFSRALPVLKRSFEDVSRDMEAAMEEADRAQDRAQRRPYRD